MIYNESTANVFYYKKSIQFGDAKTVSVKAGLGYIIPKTVIVGFSKFKFSFGKGKDHHLKNIKLKLTHQVNDDADGKNLSIKAEYNFEDDSNNKAESASVDICAVVLGEGYSPGTEKTLKIKALNYFSMSFGSVDHHVQNLGATPCGAFMEDYSGNEAKCDVKVNSIVVGSSVLKEMKEKGIFFINSFYMSNNEDHHISEVSVEVNKKSRKLVMSDKDKNRADYTQCSVNEENTPDTLLKIMNVSLHGKNHNLEAHGTDEYLISHVQGVLRYDKDYLLTHNNKASSKGFFIVVNSKGDGYTKVNLRFENYNHPGGMQRYQDYFVVGVENSNYTKSVIPLYKIRDKADMKEPVYCRTLIERDNKGAAAAGICYDKANAKYIVGVYNPHPPSNEETSVKAFIDIYEAPALSENNTTIPLESDDAKFTLTKTINFGYASAQGIGMFYDNDGELYFVKFKAPHNKSKANYIDAINIYRVDKEPTSAENKIYGCEKVACRHMHTKEGRTIAEVHFRWGSCLDIDEEGKVKLLATRRNCIGRYIYINDFS